MILALLSLLACDAKAGPLFGRASHPEVPGEAPFTYEIHSLERGEGSELHFSATRDGVHPLQGRTELESAPEGQLRAILEEREIPAQGSCTSSTRVRTTLVFDAQGTFLHPELLLARSADPCQSAPSTRTVRMKKLETLPQDSIWLSTLPLVAPKLDSPEIPGVAGLPDLLSLQLFWEPVSRIKPEMQAERRDQACIQSLLIGAGKLTLRAWDEINATQGATREWPLILEQSIEAPLPEDQECVAWSAAEWRERTTSTLQLRLSAPSRLLALALGGFLLELDFNPFERALTVSLVEEEGQTYVTAPHLSQHLLSAPALATLKKTEQDWSRALRFAWLPVIE